MKFIDFTVGIAVYLFLIFVIHHWDLVQNYLIRFFSPVYPC